MKATAPKRIWLVRETWRGDGYRRVGSLSVTKVFAMESAAARHLERLRKTGEWDGYVEGPFVYTPRPTAATPKEPT